MTTQTCQTLAHAKQIAAETFAACSAARFVTVQMFFGLVDIDRNLNVWEHNPNR